MKQKKGWYSVIILGLLAFTIQSCMDEQTGRKIKGNGVYVTKEITIDDYNAIEVAGSVDLEYQQLDEKAYFQIIVDENIFEHMDIFVKNKVLHILPSKKWNGSYELHSTKCIVRTNSRQIKEMMFAGSGTVNMLSDIDVDNLRFELAGSADVYSDKEIHVNKLDLKVAGSDNISLKGTANTCKIELAGSGNVDSPKLSVKHLQCVIAGSGKVEMDVSESIDCEIAGSGILIYTGNPPSVKQIVAGSGKVIKK